EVNAVHDPGVEVDAVESGDFPRAADKVGHVQRPEGAAIAIEDCNYPHLTVPVARSVNRRKAARVPLRSPPPMRFATRVAPRPQWCRRPGAARSAPRRHIAATAAG